MWISADRGRPVEIGPGQPAGADTAGGRTLDSAVVACLSSQIRAKNACLASGTSFRGNRKHQPRAISPRCFILAEGDNSM